MYRYYLTIILVVAVCTESFADLRRQASHSRIGRFGLDVGVPQKQPVPEKLDAAETDSKNVNTAKVPEDKAGSLKPITSVIQSVPSSALEYAQTRLDTVNSRRLRAKVMRTLKSHRIGTSQVGIVIADAVTGREWFSLRPDKSLNPASTMKLFTSAVALARLGPTYRFQTEVWQKDGVVYLRGNGDPMLDTAALRTLATQAAAQLPELTAVVVDDSAFQGGVLPPGFGAKITDASYRASTGAVALNFGTTMVEVRPRREGKPARVTLDPPGNYVIVKNQTRTVVGNASTVRIRVKKSGNRSAAWISGKIGYKRARPTWARRRVEHPPLAAGYAFKALLKSCGASIDGKVSLGTVPKGATKVAFIRSKPLIRILAKMNKESNNFIAEMILRGLVASSDGTADWSAGQSVVREFLQSKLGLDETKFEYNNGSGLYKGGRFSARQVAKLLVFMNHHPHRDLYRGTFAVSGKDGTLKDRLGGRLYRAKMVGKTGTLNNVSALSGYARNRSGKRLAFSILMNATGGATRLMRRVQDQIVTHIVDSR